MVTIMARISLISTSGRRGREKTPRKSRRRAVGLVENAPLSARECPFAPKLREVSPPSPSTFEADCQRRSIIVEERRAADYPPR